mmetsp:Transcript_3894/g.13720  ORF Transcript_3894/g.13720 Transcript_3894/m.13720 type:complete len:235 (-) Transcript_3894:97-801(-)
MQRALWAGRQVSENSEAEEEGRKRKGRRAGAAATGVPSPNSSRATPACSKRGSGTRGSASRRVRSSKPTTLRRSGYWRRWSGRAAWGTLAGSASVAGFCWMRFAASEPSPLLSRRISTRLWAWTSSRRALRTRARTRRRTGSAVTRPSLRWPTSSKLGRCSASRPRWRLPTLSSLTPRARASTKPSSASSALTSGAKPCATSAATQAPPPATAPPSPHPHKGRTPRTESPPSLL